MVKTDSTAASNPLSITAYSIADSIVHLDDVGADLQIGIGSLVNRDDLVARLSADDALRVGSWHGAYVERKHRPDYANPTKSYVVYDGRKAADSTVWGHALSSRLDSSDVAIQECVAARAAHPEACVIESARFF